MYLVKKVLQYINGGGLMIWQNLLLALSITIIIFITFSILKRYVLNRLSVNRWIVLIASIFLWFVPIMLKYLFNIGNIFYISILFYAVSVLSFLWFLDLFRQRSK